MQRNSKEIIDPILDVMGGVDGGVAFAQLHHSLMPELIKAAAEGNEKAISIVKAFELVGQVCKLLLK